ncbi:MAG: F0F1 ATP synthase subunit gamma, partial [Eubacteriales bacterium]
QFLLGSFSSVSFVYQHFKNMLTQIPSKKQLLPLSDDITNGGTTDVVGGDGILYIPDKETVMKNACLTCVDSSIYSTILEAATGAQAATLMAMREASDNAKESIAALELEISRKRQSEVTSSVIETYSPEEEQNN